MRLRSGRLLSLFWMLVGVLCLLTSPAGAARPVKEVNVLIAYKGAPGAAEEKLIRKQGGTVKHRYWLVPAVAARVPEAALAALARNPNVAAIEPDAEVSVNDIELDNAWGVARIGGGVAHDGGYTGAGVRVAVIDTGINYNHVDLAAAYAGGWDFVNNDADPMDDHGHGTHCAGTVAAADNGVGVVGVAPGVELYALKVLGANGSGSFSSIIAALQWCINQGIQVTSNSYGAATDPGSIVRQAFDNAAAAGIVNVAAAGNTGNSAGTGDNVDYPARFTSVIAVAATNQSDVRASFSSTGPDVEVSAPGQSVYSTTRNGGYGNMSGTSMACPHVAGAAAVLVGAGVSNVADVRYLLAMTSVDLGTAGVDPQYGYGLVDVALALTLVEETPPPPPESEPPPTSPPPAPSLVSVDWIDYGMYGGKQNNKHLTVAVAVVDEFGSPVSGAAVSVRITRNGTGALTGQATTDSSGLAFFTISNAKAGTYTTVVTSLGGGRMGRIRRTIRS